MTNSFIQQSDITIIGGNMVGASLALSLVNSPLKVTLIEQNAVPNQLHEPFDMRVSAIIPAAERFLKSLSAWEYIPECRKQSFTRMSVWEHTLDDAFYFNSEEGEPLGHIIENNVMQWALWQRIKQTSIHCIQGRWRYIEQTPDFVKITLEDGQVIHTRLLVGADGPQSKVRQAAGIKHHIHHYNQMCIVGATQTEYHHHNTCWQRYHDGLACAFLPLNEQFCSLAWYVKPEDYQTILALTRDEQIHQLTLASGGSLGKVNINQTLQGFPITRLTVDQWFNHRIVLAGDAAHVIHPMAGQGVNLGYIDTAILAEELLNAREYFDHEVTLKRYQIRRAETAVIQYSMDAFNYFFQSAPGYISRSRSKSLMVANRLSFLKKYFANYAMGNVRDLPQSMLH